MNPELLAYIDSLKAESVRIPLKRGEKIREISDFILEKLQNKKPARVVFICTHNSRRSLFCQIWAATLAGYMEITGLEIFSGGTEATAFNSRAVEAIRRAGFDVENPGGKNPRYRVFYAKGDEPLICYSKTFDDRSNPEKDFAAVVTCSDADRNCPFVPGAEFRSTIPFDDPKQADGTPEESRIYDERCRQIAAEMYFMLSRL